MHIKGKFTEKHNYILARISAIFILRMFLNFLMPGVIFKLVVKIKEKDEIQHRKLAFLRMWLYSCTLMLHNPNHNTENV